MSFLLFLQTELFEVPVTFCTGTFYFYVDKTVFCYGFGKKTLNLNLEMWGKLLTTVQKGCNINKNERDALLHNDCYV